MLPLRHSCRSGCWSPRSDTSVLSGRCVGASAALLRACLQSLAELYGYSATQTHQAVDDVLMNEYVLNCMLQQMGEQGE